MKYTDLIENIREPIFSPQDLRLDGLHATASQLSHLVRLGKMTHLKNGLFCLASNNDSIIPEAVAFRMYQPSYISLESALSRYGLIPEMVYNVTSVTPKITRSFKNNFGLFTYRSIKKSAFCGYVTEEKNKQVYAIAVPEKALLDFLYFNLSILNTRTDIEELRFNKENLAQLNTDTLNEFAQVFDNDKLKRILSNVLNN